MTGNKIRVLVVEDSFLMRKIITDIIVSDPKLEIVGEAKDGKDALEKVFALKPDVVTLDINLPVIDGLQVLEEIMKKQPTPVIMLSAYSRQGTSATFRALELGAVDFIAKPAGEVSLNLFKLKDEIISKIKLAERIELDKFSQTPVALIRRGLKAPAIKKLVVIGASTGGPRALLEVMQQIPSGLSASFLVVQHMPEGFTLSFAERISWQSGMKAKEAEDGDIIVVDKVFVAPTGYHMCLEKNQMEVRIRLNRGPLVNFVRPSVDVTMLSAVEAFGKAVVGVVLTGMGKDGLEGARKIKEKGGFIIVQDEKTSVVWGMPKMVYKAGLADKVLPLSEIPGAIVEGIKL